MTALRMLGLMTASLLTSLALSWAGPPRASACSVAASVELGSPSAGASEVPLDVVPWVSGHFPEDLELALMGPDGEEVPITIERLEGPPSRVPARQYWELRPIADLSADSRYEIVARSATHLHAPTPLTFSTGSARASIAPDVTLGAGEIADNTSAGSSCSDQVFACVVAEAEGDVEITERSPGGVVLGRYLRNAGESLLHIRTDSPSDSPFCLEVRARDSAGRRGEAARVCSDALTTYSTTLTSGLTCRGGVLYGDDEPLAPPAPSGGCSAAPSRTGSFAALLGFLTLLVIRRRVKGCR